MCASQSGANRPYTFDTVPILDHNYFPDFKKSELQPRLPSAVPRKRGPSKPSEEPDGAASAKKKKIVMIFKDALEASVEGSGEAKPQSSLPRECESASQRLEVASSEGPFSSPKLKVEKEEEKQGVEEPSTSFCPNCVKLKRRIFELEEELSRLKGDQRDGPPGNQQAAPRPQQSPIQDLQGMETQGCCRGQSLLAGGLTVKILEQISCFPSQ